MPGGDREAALAGPAAIAVHDDRDVPRPPLRGNVEPVPLMVVNHDEVFPIRQESATEITENIEKNSRAVAQ
jgi:hypothetical protein